MTHANTPHKHTRQELRQDQVVTFYARALGFYHDHKQVVFVAAGALVALVLLIGGYYFYNRNQEQKAQLVLSKAEAVYESGDYRAAVDGTANQPGLLKVADDYGSTPSGNLATFYAADALFRLGEYDRALTYFRSYDKSKNYIGASAIAGEAAIFEAKQQFAKAGDLYKEAALYFENDLTSPQYLLSAGRAYEHAKKYDAAREVYESISKDFPESNVAGGIDFYLARVTALQNGAS